MKAACLFVSRLVALVLLGGAAAIAAGGQGPTAAADAPGANAGPAVSVVAANQDRIRPVGERVPGLARLKACDVCDKAKGAVKAGDKVACATSAACAAAKAGKKAAGKAAGAAKKKVEEAAADVADDAFVKFVQRLADGTQTALEKVSTFWLKIPSPDLASGGSGKSWTSQKAVSSLQGNLMPVAAAFAVISFAFALARIAFSPERASEGMRAIGRQLLAVSLATLPALAMTALLIEAGDQFSPWIVKQGSAGGASDGLAKLMEVAIKTGNAGVFLIVFIISLLGSITQVAFMYLRGAAIIVMFVLLPMVAAGSGTEEGWIRLKRMMMLILGFVLYKPVAAIIYATGLKLIGEDTSGDIR